MTDQQLLDAGERLYNAFLGSNFTFLELAGLAAARERRTLWTELGQNLKLAVFRLVVLSESDLATTLQVDPAAPPAVPTTARAAPADPAAGEPAPEPEADPNAPESARGSSAEDPAD